MFLFSIYKFIRFIGVGYSFSYIKCSARNALHKFQSYQGTCVCCTDMRPEQCYLQLYFARMYRPISLHDPNSKLLELFFRTQHFVSFSLLFIGHHRNVKTIRGAGPSPIQNLTDRCSRVVITRASYSEYPGFKSRLGNWLSWLSATTATFNILSDSLFTDRPAIRRCVVWAIESFST
jgi:hypothetical protein